MSQTIMIAAHDPDITYLLQRYAEESGFDTVSACQGKEIIELAHHVRPALIILDVDLPGISGRKMLAGLRAEPATRDIPVVLYVGQDEPVEALEDGAAGYLPKAVMYDDFVAMLEHAGVHNPSMTGIV